MGWSPLSTEVHNTSQYSARTQSAKGVVLHHGATTSAQQIIDMEVSGSRQVSSHQVVKDKRNAGVVQEQFRAWSLSSAQWDSWAFTVECANESTNGWTISDESHETLAQLTADWARRYGFWPHRDGDSRYWTVYGHREIYTIHGASYATACPGGMNLDFVAKRAQQILQGDLPPEPEKKEDRKVIRYKINAPKDNPLVGFDYFVEPGVAVTLSASPTQTVNLCYRHFEGAPESEVPYTNVNVTDLGLALKELGFPDEAARVKIGATYSIFVDFLAKR